MSESIIKTLDYIGQARVNYSFYEHNFNEDIQNFESYKNFDKVRYLQFF